MSTEAADVTSHLSRLSFLDARSVPGRPSGAGSVLAGAQRIAGSPWSRSPICPVRQRNSSRCCSVGRRSRVDTGTRTFSARHCTASRHIDVAMAYLDLAAPCTLDVAQFGRSAFTVHMTTVGQAAEYR